MFSQHDSRTSFELSITTGPSAIDASRGGVATIIDSICGHAKTLVIASILVAAVSTSALTVHFAGAQGVDQTGPNGGQCHLHRSGGDFVGSDNDDTTNNANISL